MELDGLNSDAVTRKFTWGLDLSGSVEGAGGIGGLLATEDTAGTTVTTDDRTFIYLYELNGNVGQLVETTTGTDYGTIAAKYEYDPYGKRINTAASGEYEQPYRFSTKPVDDETGLGCWGYRYYSYDLGRWVSRDPIEERGGVNLYGYVGNMPTAYSDADGCDLYINPASPSTVPWLPGGTDFPLDEYRPTSPSYPVANSWLQLLANYVDGTGQGVRLGRSLMTQVASTTGFRERVRQAVSGFVGKAKSAADCCEKNIRIISAGGDYVDEWGASWIPGHGLTAPFPSIQTMFSVNNYSLTWLGVGKFSCNTGSGECCLCKGTFDLSFELTDTFTLKGLKNTIFNAIPGSSFATFGKWSIDSIPFSFIHCD